MSKTYLLVICLLTASFTGCLGSDNEDTDTTNTDTDTDTTDTDTTSENNNETVTSDKAKWTFMTYISDSDLEYFAIEDMIEMERVGSTDEVNIVVQIDRWDGYDKPDWNDDSNGDWETAKRYLITKENKGDHVIGSTAIEDIGEINTGDPDELVEFVQWTQENYPAEHYALNIWNHGSGATGVAYEQSCPDYCWEYGNEADKLELSEIDGALNEITNNGENKLDIVGFDACLMATIEVVEAVAPYSDIMIGSEILEPGDGWDYSFLQLIVDNPSTNPEQLGAKIVDTFVAQGQTSDQSYALTMLNMSIAEQSINSINALAELKDSTTLISDLEAIRYDSVHVEPGDSSSAVDLLHLLTSLSEYTTDNEVKMAADQAAANVSAMIMKAEFDGDPSDIDTTGMTGVSILFPNLEDEWAKRSKGMSEESQWVELMEDYYDDQEDDLVLFFNEDSLIYDTADLDLDGHNDSITLALDVESFSDNVSAHLTLDVFNNRGYWIDGIEYEFEISSDEVVYLDLWDVYYVHELVDGESDLLRIEGVLSLLNEDGTQSLQDWVETPYEYLTAFNESRVITAPEVFLCGIQCEGNAQDDEEDLQDIAVVAVKIDGESTWDENIEDFSFVLYDLNETILDSGEIALQVIDGVATGIDISYTYRAHYYRILCEDGSKIIPESWINDGYEDCDDGSDEDENAILQLECDDGSTVPLEKYDDGHEDCPDGSDEINIDSALEQRENDLVDGMESGDWISLVHFRDNDFSGTLSAGDEFEIATNADEAGFILELIYKPTNESIVSEVIDFSES